MVYPASFTRHHKERVVSIDGLPHQPSGCMNRSDVPRWVGQSCCLVQEILVVVAVLVYYRVVCIAGVEASLITSVSGVDAGTV